MQRLITILGPTACGKTAVATRLAARFEPCAEIISADSRQVFRGMNIGTGKDLSDYEAGGTHIPYHLIDIADAGTKYSVFHFQRDFHRVFGDITSRHRQPILCGGTGLYIESVLRRFNLVEVPVNPVLRSRLEGQTLEELTALLATYKRLHNTTDVDTTRRAIRAIEIEEYYRTHDLSHHAEASLSDAAESPSAPPFCSLTIGLDIPRDVRRQRITDRLHRRFSEEDMTGEVRGLLDAGVPAEALISYGLEYRYITLYLLGQLSYDEMVRQLEIAIHQFSKRQMTYFRGMERRGVAIHWLDATASFDELAEEIFRLFLASFTEKL
ncbi:MAG: tRNA (adenosine(37)-N6)-dimethylallyltransferase MiaA [Bacteroidaceae bacterium]|nr:tRNA (adenosine(37)-N6)-dimethylallyltransferase MiaA [Bacteroidaceae bacterium]